MRSLKKKQNYKSEEYFHNEWARSVSLDEIDVFSQFEGKTSPEYREVIRTLGKVKNKRILNLGCGLGEETVYLASLGARVTAIDISKGMLNFTKKLALKHEVKNISCYQMSAERLAFRNNNFDAVVGCNILHHVDIEKTILQVKRVLKADGMAVFSEPLAYNPIVNVYRSMATNVRTDHEHPLTYGDLERIRRVFPNMIHKEFHLFTLFIFAWFFIGERLHPNKVRYWKKIIIEAEKYKTAFKFLYSVDCVLLKLLPFLRRFCWVTVIKVQKNNAD